MHDVFATPGETTMFRATNTTLANAPGIDPAVTATAGGTKAAAYQLIHSVSRVAVCASAGDSVLLTPAVQGACIMVINDGAASCQVFGQGTDTIDEIATGTGVAIATTKRRIFFCYAPGKWSSLLGA